MSVCLIFIRIEETYNLFSQTNELRIIIILIYFKDSVDNSHTVTQMVQVENVEHRLPRWMTVFAVQQFDEKTVQNFSLRAIDGDTGIDKLIEYRLERDDDGRSTKR